MGKSLNPFYRWGNPGKDRLCDLPVVRWIVVADLGLGHTWASGSMVFAAIPQLLELMDVNHSNEVP